jgi:predicted DNA repair protein MutK
MAAGLFALLDDVAALARLAAASLDDVSAAAGRATTKAAGVVVDDTAVTPQYVHGVTADRELPMIRRIAVGSLRNKLVIILPVALLLSQFVPWLLTPVLMLGGTYLSYEGAEKVWERLRGPGARHVAGHGEGHGPAGPATAAEGGDGGDAAAVERAMVAGAIRTDLILSAEIMVIALDEVADEAFLARLLILVVVALVITFAVYGVVAVIVKLDDVGLHLAERSSAAARRVGRALVVGTPRLLAGIAAVGVVAMLWVGGHIIVAGLDELGWHAPYSLVHHLEHAVHEATGPLGAVLGWLTATLASAVVGLVLGAVVVAVLHVVPRGLLRRERPADS